MKVQRKKRVIQQSVIYDESFTICDKCNERIVLGNFEDFECKFTHKTGESYPEGGSGEKQEMDLCQKCAPDLVVLLRENGYNVIDSEWDW